MTNGVYCRSWLFALAAPLAAAACATTAETPADRVGPAAPTTPAYVLSDILDAPAAAVDALLGPPALTRREGAGEYRRYGLSACTLIVILYPDDAGVARARHVDAAALNADEDKPDLAACLAAG